MITANEMCKHVYGQVSKAGKAAFISAMVCGFFAHGYMMANRISFHDDVKYMFNNTGTLISGRWTLEIINRMGKYLSVNASSSWYNGLLALLCIAISAVLVVEMFEIQEELQAVMVAAVLVVFPTVAATFAYIFTAPAYFLDVLLMCIAGFLHKEDSMPRIIGSGILISIALGIYQAYIGIFTSLALLFLLKLTICENRNYKYILRKILNMMISGAIGIGIYLFMNKLLGILFNQTSLYSEHNLAHLPNAVIAAYKKFYEFFKNNFYGINPYIGLQWIMKILILFTIVGFFYIIFHKKDLSRVNKLLGIILFCLFPLAVNFMYVVTLNDVTVHALMLYPLSLVFLLPYVVFAAGEDKVKNNSLWAISIGMLLIICSFIKVDNVAYQHSSFAQEQAISYFTNLVGSIKSCEGYSDELPVAFLGMGTNDMEDASMTIEDRFQVSLTALEFNMKQVVDNHAYKYYLAMHCGYSPIYIENEEKEKLKENPEVQAMPCYPRGGQ